VEALCKAVNKYEVKKLFLRSNQLGDAGAESIAAMLRTNRSLTYLHLMGNQIGAAGGRRCGRPSEAARASNCISRARSKNLA